MEKKKFKLGLFPKLIIAIIIGILFGQFLPVWFCRIVVTLSSIFSTFLSFIIPLMILAYVTMGIANLKSGAGKLLLITVILAYLSTLAAGSASFLVADTLFPSFMSDGALEQIAATAGNSLESYFSLEIPPLFDTLSAVVLAFVLALAAGRWPVVEVLLRPYVLAIKAVPVASFIIICLIWMSTRQLAVFISFLMVFPVIYSNTLQGIKSADGALLEMARVYRVPFSRRLGYIYAPQVKPFLLSGCSVALGMSWKSGVAAEVIGVVGGSIGERLYEAKVYFQMTDLLAWTVVIVVCSVGFEKLVLWLLRRCFAAWEGR